MYVTNTQPAPPPAQAAARRPASLPKRLVRWGCLLLVLVVGLVLGTSLSYRLLGDDRLSKAVAQIEADDPSWRWANLHRDQAVIPPERNAANAVTKASQLLPPRWAPQVGIAYSHGDELTRVSLDSHLRDLLVTQPLDANTEQALAEALKPAAPALTEARRLVDMPEGLFSLPATSTEYRTSRNESLNAVRRTTSLLWLDACESIHRQDSAGALATAQAALNAGRAVGNEPALNAQLNRLASVSLAMRAVERWLAHGQPTAEALAALQREFEIEQGHALMICGLRGERALVHEMMDETQRGTLLRFQGADLIPYCLIDAESWLGKHDAVQKSERWLKHGWYTENQGRIHEMLTRLIAIHRQPLGEQMEAVTTLQRRLLQEQADTTSWPLRHRALFVYLYMPGVFRAADICHRHQAELNAAIAGLAAERYRLKHGQWPANLAALVPEFLAEIPVDPFAPGPLLYRRLDDGIACYGVGRDGQDNGGNIDRSRGNVLFTDRGFQLWDVEKRGQAAR